jgi:hypothetical protein
MEIAIVVLVFLVLLLDLVVSVWLRSKEDPRYLIPAILSGIGLIIGIFNVLRAILSRV